VNRLKAERFLGATFLSACQPFFDSESEPTEDTAQATE